QGEVVAASHERCIAERQMESWRQGVEVCGRLSCGEGVLRAADVVQGTLSKGVRFTGIRPQGDGSSDVPDGRIRRNRGLDESEPASSEPFGQGRVQRDRS